MLILTRRARERIMIGDDIVVQVLSVQNGHVKLGITAPDMPVHREEIYEKIKANNEHISESNHLRESGQGPGDEIHPERDSDHDDVGGDL